MQGPHAQGGEEWRGDSAPLCTLLGWSTTDKTLKRAISKHELQPSFSSPPPPESLEQPQEPVLPAMNEKIYLEQEGTGGTFPPTLIHSLDNLC